MAREVVKRVKNAVLYSDGLIRIDRIRFSYPHLKKAYAGDDGGEPKYGLVGLLPKDTHKAAKKLCDERIAEILSENKVKAIPADKKFIRDGDESGKEENEGMWTVSARESRRPSLRDRQGEVVEPEDADEYFVGGYWGSMLIRPWWQNHKKYGKRVNAGLVLVQYWKKDDTFGEGRISDEELDDMMESYDDDDDSYDDDDDERPARRKASSKRRSRDEDDDDDRPSRKRRSRDDDDDEDERPKRRRSRDDDDDDDDRPARRKRRSRDDDDDDDDI